GENGSEIMRSGRAPEKANAISTWTEPFCSALSGLPLSERRLDRYYSDSRLKTVATPLLHVWYRRLYQPLEFIWGLGTGELPTLSDRALRAGLRGRQAKPCI